MIMSMTGTLRKVAGHNTLRASGSAVFIVATFMLAGVPTPDLAQAPGLSNQYAVGAIARSWHGFRSAGPSTDAPEPSVGNAGGTIGSGRSDPTTLPPQTAALPPDRMEPDAIVGLDPSQTKRLLGMPSATEDEAPARVWRYARGGCTLRVFFFKDMISQGFRALSYDMTSSQDVPDDDQRCFAHLVSQAGDDRRD